jgi:PPM family protein phosphatase
MVVASSRLESGGRGEDRVAVERAGGRFLVVVADGAGGTGGAALAAQAVCDAAVANFRGGHADSWPLLLERIDSLLASAGHGGQSTAVLVEIADGQVRGASVGDSEAWLVLTVRSPTLPNGRYASRWSGAALPAR